MIFLNCPRSIARDRFLTRQIEGREDGEDVFNRRYDEFVRLNASIVEHYRRQDKLIEVNFGIKVKWI